MNNYNENYSNDFENYAVSNYMQELVENELDDGETVEWIDQPVPVFFSAQSTAAFLFAIPWTAFSIFWIGAASFGVFANAQKDGVGFDIFFPLFGLPFVLIGFVMLSSPYWFYRKQKRTVYAVTNQRVIVASFGWKHDITSYTADEIKNVKRNQKKNSDCGNIIIKGEENKEYELFVNVRNARAVEQTLRHWKQNYKPETE